MTCTNSAWSPQRQKPQTSCCTKEGREPAPLLQEVHKCLHQASTMLLLLFLTLKLLIGSSQSRCRLTRASTSPFLSCEGSRREDLYPKTRLGEHVHRSRHRLGSRTWAFLTLEQEVKKSSLKLLYDLSRLALTPRGGSMVTLELFWRMDTGKWLLGRLVSQRRKSCCT